MKPLYFILTVFLTLIMLLLPVIALNEYKKGEDISFSLSENKNSVKVFVKSLNTVQNVDKKSYLFSAVANSLSKNAKEEAVTAVALSFKTYIEYLKTEYPQRNFDIDDFEQNYLPKEELLKTLKTKWGTNYETVKKTFLNGVEKALKYSIYYKNKPIMAKVHKISGGKTESAKNILGTDIPYLVSVESAGDLLNENFESKITVPAEEFKNKLNGFLNININFPENTQNYISKINKTECGTVTGVIVTGKTAENEKENQSQNEKNKDTPKEITKEIKGEEFKNIFNLKSSNFTVVFKNNSFLITSFGEGDFLGLSISGAEYMANSGSNFKDIINWYYKNTEIIKK